MRKRSGPLGILSCMAWALAGCGEASFEENRIDEGPIAEAEQALETSNMLSANALEINALEINALEINALEINALEINALEINGLTAAFNNTEPATALAHATRGELFEELFRYIYSCAMPANMSMQLPVVRNGQAETVTFQGSLGLAPQWATGACDANCQHWVSACVLARVNAYHIPVKISLRGNHPALTTTQAEIDSYPIFEGTFYGNIFDRSELKSPFNVCRGTGADMGHITSRACAKAGGYCSMNATGDCSTQCNGVDGTCAATNSADASVNVPAIEVWLAPPAEGACGNAVCEAGETQASCAYDCTPSTTVDHEPAGTSATTLVSASLNGSNVVYAGITTSTSPLMGLSALDTGTKTSRDMFIVRGNGDGTYGAMKRIALANEDPVVMDARADNTGAGNIALVTSGVGTGSLRVLDANTLATKWTEPLYQTVNSGFRIESLKIEGNSFIHALGTVMSLSGGVWTEVAREYRKYEMATGEVYGSRSLSFVQAPWVSRMAQDGGTYMIRASGSSTLELRTYGAPGYNYLDTTASLDVPGMTNIAPKGLEEGVFVVGNGTTSDGRPGAFIGRVYSGNNSWAWMTTISPDPERSIEIQSMQVRGHVVLVMGKFKGPLDFRGSTPTTVPSARAGVNGNEDMFVAAYEISTGALSWVRTYGGPGVDNPDTFTVDETNRLWLFGRFVGTPRIEGSYAPGRDGDTGTDSMRIVVGPVSLAQSSPIVAGPNASYAVRDGQLWAWGSNQNGNLGFAPSNPITQPTATLSGVVKAAGAVLTGFALRADGTVWVAGDNSGCGYGDGAAVTPWNAGTWFQVPGLSGIVDIAASHYHVLALQSNGKVWGWGYNSTGQLGLGYTSYPVCTPTEIPGLSGSIGLAAYYFSSAVLRADGSVYVFGYNGNGFLNPADPATNILNPTLLPGMSKMVSIALGRDTLLGLQRDGTVWASGRNGYGGLGTGTFSATAGSAQVSGLNDVVSIANGWQFSTAVRRDGTVWTWGRNFNGSLGIESTSSRATPVAVPGLTDVVQVVSGYAHTTTRNRRGDMGGFGDNSFSQITGAITNATVLPTRIQKLSDATNISASRNAAFVVRNDDVLRSCGNGALGDSSVKMRPYFENVFGLSHIKQAASGQEHGLAVSNTGNVYAWGRNVFGQLGDGTRAERQAPKFISSLSGITKVAAGDWFSLALGGNGTAYAFGDNSKLALGVSGVNAFATPIALSGVGTVVDIAAGANHGLLGNAAGQLYAWGNDAHGQLGRGVVTGTNLLPQVVTGLSGVIITKVAAAENHNLALDLTGHVWVFGDDSYGQLGLGTTAPSRPAPLPMAGVSNAIAIATSAGHSLILLTDGTVMAVGNNSSGQLGDGTTVSRSTPSVVPGLSNVVAIAAGDSHSMVLKSDGTVWTFGSRSNGQLCDGLTHGNALTPTQVMGL